MNVKSILLAITFFASMTCLVAQTTKTSQKTQKAFEVKTNPLFLLIPDGGIFPISAELILKETVGIEADFYLGAASAAYLSGRFYLNPQKGADRFFVGGFAGYVGVDGESGVGAGFLLGTKVVSSKGNVVFDIAIGLGRATTISVIPYGALNVGYRFNSKNLVKN
jgi:hypothetical protein